MSIRYEVNVVRDDHGALRDRLDVIANEGSRVISITWQPERCSDNGVALSAGFTIISEADI